MYYSCTDFSCVMWLEPKLLPQNILCLTLENRTLTIINRDVKHTSVSVNISNLSVKVTH